MELYTFTRRKEAHNIYRGGKRMHISKIIKMVEPDHRVHRSRQLYQKMNGIRNVYKGQEKFIRNKYRELITTKIKNHKSSDDDGI